MPAMNDFDSAVAACFKATEDTLMSRLLYGEPVTTVSSIASGSTLTAEVFLHACRLLEPPPATREVFVSPLITRQHRFPRSKKRRIRDKWRKRPCNYKPACYVTDHTVYIHPALHNQIQLYTPPA